MAGDQARVGVSPRVKSARGRRGAYPVGLLRALKEIEAGRELNREIAANAREMPYRRSSKKWATQHFFSVRITQLKVIEFFMESFFQSPKTNERNGDAEHSDHLRTRDQSPFAL